MKYLEKITERARAKTSVSALEIISQGTYYSPTHFSTIVYKCIYRDRPAVLKVYNDPREVH